ncbi:XTP/dITP diphosphatase [Thermodesulfovibrio sp.]|uniref:XTP/dITP diphosphatase n=1 Tax=Thermodesulfovibrio sp. TaxID=2067987 RepID=UPI00309E7B10
MRVVVASRNKKKIEEIRRILEGIDISLLSTDDFPHLEEVIEDGDTFEDNALKKARYVCKETGLPAIADDSGLEVKVLDGRPGVKSARYAGENATDEENVKKLLNEMKGIPPEKRQASFKCCIALVLPNGEENIFTGQIDGWITEKPRGNLGFGYDPVFIPEGYEQTFAEMKPSEKDALSHRRKALDKLKQFLLKLANFYKQNLS